MFLKNYAIQDHHLIKNTRVIVLGKLTAREICSVLLLSSGNTATTQQSFFQMKTSIGRKFMCYQEQSL